MKDTLNVVAALIWQQGKFLIGQRPANKKRGLLWEFVGGKVESGETKEQALQRECREELGAQVAVGEQYFCTLHEYADVIVNLTIFHATLLSEPQKLEHADLRWISPCQVDELEFCPADGPILLKIKQDYC